MLKAKANSRTIARQQAHVELMWVMSVRGNRRRLKSPGVRLGADIGDRKPACEPDEWAHDRVFDREAGDVYELLGALRACPWHRSGHSTIDGARLLHRLDQHTVRTEAGT